MEDKTARHTRIIRCAATLKKAGVVFGKGLSEGEVGDIEARFGFRFPPDYRAFLMYALPVSGEFMDWRGGAEAEIRRRLDWPREGILFDVEDRYFWRDDWGAYPADLEERLARAREAVAAAPRLIPLFGHRYIPETPHEEGNPVLSVYYADIIYYGGDLWEYFENEFQTAFGVFPFRLTQPIKRIPFWSDIIEGEPD